MITALEHAMTRAEGLETIPRITDPMGHGWGQPRRCDILLDGIHAVMTRADFDKLAEYSASQPSGVYLGKMWKRHDGLHDFAYRARGGRPVWLLCWHGISLKGLNWCSTNSRIILLSDGELS